ncbi:MAG TPA: DUF6292 family protein [Pseudonocardiaceae bacterium]
MPEAGVAPLPGPDGTLARLGHVPGAGPPEDDPPGTDDGSAKGATHERLTWTDSDAASAALTSALAAYVRAVAAAVGVPAEGVMFEATDTVTAYLALHRRSADHPGRDVMLTWTESQGWVLSVETAPTEPPIVLARAPGSVRFPRQVARFVADSLLPGPRLDGSAPGVRPARADLAGWMTRHTHP